MAHEETDLEKLKKEYEKLSKKYKLPSFDDFDNEFEIRKIDPELCLPHELRRVINHRLQGFAEWFEPILNPHSGSLHSLIETKIFEKQELEPLFLLYKKMWSFVHEGLHASLQSEEKEIEFIKKVWKEWPAIKKEIAGHVGRLAEGWKKHEKEKAGDSYLG